MEIVVAGLVALIIGLAIGYFAAQTIIKKITREKTDRLIKDAEAEAEVIKRIKSFRRKRNFSN